MYSGARRGRRLPPCDVCAPSAASGREQGIPFAHRPRELIRRVARKSEQLHDVVAENAVDVVHSHFAEPDGSCGALADLDCPLVVTLRGVDVLQVPSVSYGHRIAAGYSNFCGAALARAEVITVASRTSHEAASALLPAGADLRTVPNGIDRDVFRPSGRRDAVRAAHAWGDHVCLLGVGNLVPGKGYGVLVDVLAGLPSARVRLVLAGDGPEKDVLRERARQRGIEGIVWNSWGAWRARTCRASTKPDLFVHPSLSEGFGNVVLEAMAMGCAVVATRTGAAADLVRTGENGVLVPPGDRAAMLAAVRELLEDSGRREGMGARGLEETVRVGYDLSERAHRFHEIYRVALSARPASHSQLPPPGRSSILHDRQHAVEIGRARSRAGDRVHLRQIDSHRQRLPALVVGVVMFVTSTFRYSSRMTQDWPGSRTVTTPFVTSVVTVWSDSSSETA